MEENQAHWQFNAKNIMTVQCIDQKYLHPLLVLLERKLNNKKLKKKMMAWKLPSAFNSLVLKITNKWIFEGLLTSQRNVETKVQEIQKIFSASTALSLKSGYLFTNISRTLKKWKWQIWLAKLISWQMNFPLLR